MIARHVLSLVCIIGTIASSMFDYQAVQDAMNQRNHTTDDFAHSYNLRADHGPPTRVVLWSGTVIAGLLALVKILSSLTYPDRKIRWTRWLLDDTVFTCAWVCSLLQSGIVCEQIRHGLGRSIVYGTRNSIIAYEKSAYAAQFPYILSVNLVRVGCTLFVLRLEPHGPYRKPLRRILFFIAFYTTAVCIAASAVCTPPSVWRPWQGISHCIDRFDLWICAEPLGMLTDIILTTITFKVLWTLQKPRRERLALLLPFLMRLVACLFLLIRLIWMSRLPDQSNDHGASSSTFDPTFKEAPFAVVTSFAMHANIALSCIPYLRRLQTRRAGTPNLLRGTERTEGPSRQRYRRDAVVNSMVSDLHESEVREYYELQEARSWGQSKAHSAAASPLEEPKEAYFPDATGAGDVTLALRAGTGDARATLK